MKTLLAILLVGVLSGCAVVIPVDAPPADHTLLCEWNECFWFELDEREL